MVRRQLLELSRLALLVSFLALVFPAFANAQAKGKGAEKAAEVKQVHQQIAAMKKQRDATVKRVRDLFGKMIRQDKLTKVEIEEHRAHLVRERNALAAAAGSAEQKALVHQHFDPVIHQLGNADKLDNKQIEALKTERHEMVKNVEHQYNAAIKVLEAQAKALSGGGKKK